jgi:hypothetical protein
MKTLLWILVGSLSLTGCATSTVESRKHQRLAAYHALSAEDRRAVDAGQIRVGMPMDAVYIAWGKPSQIVPGDPSQGVTVTWLYRGTYPVEQSFWSDYDRWHDSGYYTAPYAAHDSHPRSYVRAEVRFTGGVVKEWSSLPGPGD